MENEDFLKKFIYEKSLETLDQEDRLTDWLYDDILQEGERLGLAKDKIQEIYSQTDFEPIFKEYQRRKKEKEEAQAFKPDLKTKYYAAVRDKNNGFSLGSLQTENKNLLYEFTFQNVLQANYRVNPNFKGHISKNESVFTLSGFEYSSDMPEPIEQIENTEQGLAEIKGNVLVISRKAKIFFKNPNPVKITPQFKPDVVISEKPKTEPVSNWNELFKDTKIVNPTQNPNPINVVKPVEKPKTVAQPTITPAPKPVPAKKKNNQNWINFITIGIILFAIYQVFIWYQENNNAGNGTVLYANTDNLMFRSAPNTTEENVLKILNYGEKVSLIKQEDKWTKVKFEGKTGFIFADFLYSEADYQLVEHIFGNSEARQLVPQARYKLALKNYFRSSGFAERQENWQIFSEPEGKYNTVYYSKSYSRDYFACILKNKDTGKRKFILFSFMKNEYLSLVEFEEESPAVGNIKYVDIVRKQVSYTR